MRFSVWELYWPRGNRRAQVIEGGEIAGINGYIHMIDDVLIYEPDLRAHACSTEPVFVQLLIVSLVMVWRPGWIFQMYTVFFYR